MGLSVGIWKNEIAVLEALRTTWNDQVSVVDGHLQLEKGNKPGKVQVANFQVLGEHFTKLIHVGRECFKSLQASKTESPQFYEQVADFKRQNKCIYKHISNMQYMLRSMDPQQAERYSALFDVSYKFFSEIKEYKKALIKPPLEQRPVKHIQYDERTELTSIKWSYPKRVPVKETVAAAKRALEIGQAPSKSKYIECITTLLKGALLTPVLIGAIFLTALKIILWNPLEWLMRKEIRTQTPFRMFLDAIKSENTHLKAYQLYSKQLLHCPVINQEVADAFIQLAPHAACLDLESAILASEDIKDYRSPHAVHPFITPKTLMELLQAASTSSTCKKIKLSKDLAELPVVREALKQHSYRLKKDGELQKTYRRYSLF